MAEDRSLAAAACRPTIRSDMLIRPARPEDGAAAWAILEPVIRTGETLPWSCTGRSRTACA
jgi:hypothetical protein